MPTIDQILIDSGQATVILSPPERIPHNAKRLSAQTRTDNENVYSLQYLPNKQHPMGRLPQGMRINQLA